MCKKIRTEVDTIMCGEYISEGYTTLQVEQRIGIPHSTAHWLIMHKLKYLDVDLYNACLITFNSHKGGRRNKEFDV